MSVSIGDNENSELSKDAKRLREQPRMPAAEQLFVTSAPTVPSSTHVHQDRLTNSESVSDIDQLAADLQRRMTAAPRRRENSALAMIGRIAVVSIFAVLVALLVIFAKPLWQGARALLNADSQTLQASKPSDRLTVNNAPPNSPLDPATKIAAASGAEPSASPQAQQAPLSPISHPLGQEPKSVNSPVRGVTDSEIRFGISAPFSGAAKELGQNMKLGIEAAFNVANASGGVQGRQLRLIAADDGYEPTRTAETIKQLYESDQVFGLVGNVGTPTAVIALP
jgi:Periplasmic binding protein